MQIQPTWLSASLIALASFSSGLASAGPALLGTIAAKNPAFLHLVPGRDAGTQELIVSSFGMFGGDAVGRVSLNDGSLGSLGTAKVQAVTTKVSWPNEVTPVPEEIFGPNFLAVGTGFLVPGRSTGEIAVVNEYTGEQFAISSPKSGYFYHRAVFIDMNGDGRLDILTARAHKGLMGTGGGELLWLEQPAGDKKGPWQEHVIAVGPDVHFALLPARHQDAPVIVAAEFFSRNLSVLWRDGQTWQRRVVDDTLGAAFDVVVADLNGDGRPDVLVTNHEGKGRGAVFAYEVPADFATAPWTRHDLASGIVVTGSGFNAAAPGAPVLWTPKHQAKPNILVAGDGSQKVHLLRPNSQDSTSWDYQQTILLEAHSTVGSLAIGDVIGNGGEQLFAPAYDAGKIYVFDLDK